MAGGFITILGWILTIFSGIMIIRTYLRGKKEISAETELKEEKRLRKIEQQELELAQEEERFDIDTEKGLEEIRNREEKISELEKRELQLIGTMDVAPLIDVISKIREHREVQQDYVIRLEKQVKKEKHRQHKLNYKLWELNQKISVQRGENTRTMEKEIKEEEEEMKQEQDIERDIFKDFNSLAEHVKKELKAVISRQKKYIKIDEIERKLNKTSKLDKLGYRKHLEKSLKSLKEDVMKELIKERKELQQEVESFKKAQEQLEAQEKLSEELEKKSEAMQKEEKTKIRSEKDVISEMKDVKLGVSLSK